MRINEHCISEYTVNGHKVYHIAVVYQIGKGGSELVAHLTVDPEGKNTFDCLGTEPTGSDAETKRVFNLQRFAADAVQKYVALSNIDGPNNVYRHEDYR